MRIYVAYARSEAEARNCELLEGEDILGEHSLKEGRGYKLKLIILFLFDLFFIFFYCCRRRDLPPSKDPSFCILQRKTHFILKISRIMTFINVPFVFV